MSVREREGKRLGKDLESETGSWGLWYGCLHKQWHLYILSTFIQIWLKKNVNIHVSIHCVGFSQIEHLNLG